VSRLADFLAGASPDAHGRSHADILAFPDEALEARHDFIQWLFPLPEPSRAVPGSPVLSEEDIAAVSASPAARANLRAAAQRMIAFYTANDHWLAGTDHNHLRITRIIRSLRLLAGDADADGFRDKLLALVAAAGTPVNATSLRFWRQA
jgi:hypothetical protein